MMNPARLKLVLCSGLLCALGGLAGCVSTTTTKAGSDDIKAPRTQSDQTDVDKRANVHVELAEGYFGRGMYSTALDETKQALAIKPKGRDVMNLQALIYAAMDQTRLAEETFRDTLEAFPNDPDTLHNLGWMLCQQRRYDEANVRFDAALAQPGYRAPSRTLLAKGVCQARAGHMPEAQASLAKAFEDDPSSPGVAFNLADVLFRNKQDPRALFYVKRVNALANQVTAQSLWLQLRIERRMGDVVAARETGAKLHKQFAQAPETQALDAGRFNE